MIHDNYMGNRLQFNKYYIFYLRDYTNYNQLFQTQQEKSTNTIYKHSTNGSSGWMASYVIFVQFFSKGSWNKDNVEHILTTFPLTGMHGNLDHLERGESRLCLIICPC